MMLIADDDDECVLSMMMCVCLLCVERNENKNKKYYYVYNVYNSNSNCCYSSNYFYSQSFHSIPFVSHFRITTKLIATKFLFDTLTE